MLVCDGIMVKPSKCYARILTILIVFLCNISHTAASQNLKSASSNKTETLSLTLSQAIDFALDSNRNLIQSEYSLQNQQIALDSARSDFDFKVRLSASIGTGDGRETFDR